MLEKLYEQGYLNYHILILNNYKKLEIQEADAIVLIKMLDIYKTNKKIRVNKLTQETGMSKKQVEECLNNLITKNIYGIDVVVNDAGLNDERVSFVSLFDKLESLFKEESVLKVENNLKSIIESYEQEIKRPVSPQEYMIFEDFLIKDGFTILEIEQALKEAVKINRITLSQIEKNIISNRKKSITGSPVIDANKKKALDKIFDLL